MKRQTLIIALLVLMIVTAGCDVSDVQDQVEENLADYGDAPDPGFPSRLLSNGARHYVVTSAWLGEDVDSELDSNQVDADRRDDGLKGTDPIEFTVTNKNWEENLYVNILIDRNEDGDWENETNDGPDPNEWAVVNMKVDVPVGETKLFKTKVSLPDETWMRMTLTTSPLRNWFGEGEFKVGETEDYIFSELTTTTTTIKKTPPPSKTPPPKTPPPKTFPPITPGPIRFSCDGNTWSSKVGFNPFSIIGGKCDDDCPPGQTCDALSCTCSKIPPKVEKCSEGFTGVFGLSSFDPATEVCRNDCDPIRETCNPDSCVCEPIKDEKLCSRGPHYTDFLGFPIPGILNGEVCKDDCNKDSEICNPISCECEDKPRKEVSCSGSDDFNLGYDQCKDDCNKDNEICFDLTCTCVEIPQEVSCSAGSKDFRQYTDYCSPDCDDGLRCDTTTCKCEKPEKFSCSDKRSTTSDYSTDKSKYTKNVDICENNCDEDEWCYSGDCSCVPKREVLCSKGTPEGDILEGYHSKYNLCKDDCPEGNVCNSECVCINVEKIEASCAFDTRPRNWNVCRDNCEIKGEDYLCNTETCVCEKIEPKEYKCYENLQEVDRTDINNFKSGLDRCEDNCPTGYECAESSCTCIKEKEIPATCASDTKPRDWNICRDDCPQGQTCNTESCICEGDEIKTAICLTPGSSYTSEDRPEGWNVCDSTTCPQGYTCNTAECLCERDQLSCDDITINDKDAFELTPSGLSACEKTCLQPDECLIMEGDPTCYYCQEFICPSGTTEDSNCNNQCDSGYTCMEVQSSGCYNCECAIDLGFSSTGSSHYWSRSTSCVDSVCTSECTYSSSWSASVRNYGYGTSLGGSVMVDMGPFGGSMTMGDPGSFGPIGPGGTSVVGIPDMNRFATVAGSSCSGLSWWVNVGQQYEVMHVIEGGGTDCDPSDNTVTGVRTLTDD